MEEVLRALYKLQQIDLELDELNEGGGDLPSEVDALQREYEAMAKDLKREAPRRMPIGFLPVQPT